MVELKVEKKKAQKCVRRVRRMKNWQNIFSIRKQRGKIHYTLLERKNIQWFVCYPTHSLQYVFYFVMYCRHRYAASDGYMIVILVVFGL